MNALNATIAASQPPTGINKWSTRLTFAMGGILAFNGFAEIFGIFEASRLQNMPDPIFGIPSGCVSFSVAALELLSACLCLLTVSKRLNLSLVIWLLFNILVYRTGLWAMGWHHPYAWAQGLMNSLNISPLRADIGSIIIFGGIIWSGLMILWFEHRVTLAAETAKMSCPGCGVHIRFAWKNAGQKIPCPRCQAGIILRQPDLLKVTCFFCQGHIEFPNHAIGEKMPCPHCNMDITLKEPA